MIGVTYRRRRRRWWWLLALVAVLVAVGATLSSGDSGEVFVEDLRKETEAVAAVAGPYRDMLAGVAGMGRLELDDLTGDVLDTLTAATAASEESDAPGDLVGAVEIYRLALASWTSGVTAFRDAALAAVDSSPGVPVEDLLTDALLDMRAGDRLYVRFLDAAGRPDLPHPVVGYASLSLLPDPFPIVSSSESIAASARQPGNPLALLRSVGIEQVATEPEWVLDTEDALVVPDTTSLVFKVVVANKGNAASEPTQATLVLRSSSGATELTAEVGALAAGTSSTVTLPAAPVIPGTSYEVEVRLGLADGDVDPEDNVRIMAFRVNEPTPPSSPTTAG